MNWLHRLSARLNPNVSQITPTLFGLSGLLLLFAAADLVFRRLLGLPKEAALYLSILSETVLLSIWIHRLQIKAQQVEPPTEEEES